MSAPSGDHNERPDGAAPRRHRRGVRHDVSSVSELQPCVADVLQSMPGIFLQTAVKQPADGRGRIRRQAARHRITAQHCREGVDAGESIGHWEGETLVVDTTAITHKAELRAGVKTSGRAHVTERIRLRDKDHLQIDTVVEDPIALKAPWRYSRIHERSNPGFFERVCLDNNRDVHGGDVNLIPPKD